MIAHTYLVMQIPGSHKASMSLPGVDTHATGDFAGQGFGLSADPTALESSGHLVRVPLDPGDCLIFLAAGVTHGAACWEGAVERRTILMAYSSQHTAAAAAAAAAAPEHHPRL